MTNSFILNLIVYLAVNLALFLGWFWLFKVRFKLDNGLNTILTFIFAHVQIVLTSMFLGLVVHRLYAPELFLLNLLTSLIFLYCARFNLSDFWNSLKETKKQLFSSHRPGAWLMGFIFVSFLLLLNLLVLIVLFGPTSWDDYNYHLQFVADIIRSGSIRYFESTHVYTISYPHNIELFNLWQIIFFRNDFLTELVNLNFLLFAAVSVYLLCRQLKSTRKLALISSLLIFAIPVLVLAAKSTKVDIVIWTLFPAVLYLLLRIDAKNVFKRSGFVIITGIFAAMGIIFGSKSSAFVYLLIFYLAFLFRLVSSGRKLPHFFRNLVGYHLLLLLALLFSGSFWYFRSWYYFGNPFYPISFRLLGREFPGLLKDTDLASGLPQIENRDFISRLFYVWQEREAWYGVFYIVDGKIGGLGALWYVVLLPSYLVALAIALAKKNSALLFTLTPALLVMLIIPGNWISHYTGFIAIFGLVAFNYLLNFVFKAKVERALALFFAFFTFVFTFTLTIDSSYFLPEATLQRITTLSDSAPTSVLYKKLNVFVNQNIRRDEKIVTGKIWFPYALYASDFRNDVIFIPVGAGDEDAWLARLENENPRFVVVMADSVESQIAESKPDLFSKMLTDEAGPTYLFAYNRYRK